MQGLPLPARSLQLVQTRARAREERGVPRYAPHSPLPLLPSSSHLSAALPAGGLVTLVIVGVFLLLISIIGWLGVRFNYKAGGRYILGIYAFVLIIIMIMEWAAAGTLITFSGKLDDFGPALAVKDAGIYYMINQSYVDCCCSNIRCPNDTCWLPANLLYPCDSLERFNLFMAEYISDRLVPIGVIAILMGLIQLFTAVTACCNQCKGKEIQEKKKIGGPLSYEGNYPEEDSNGYTDSYTSYVKGEARAGSAAAVAAAGSGATAPRAGGPARPAGRPAAGGRAPTAAARK